MIAKNEIKELVSPDEWYGKERHLYKVIELDVVLRLKQELLNKLKCRNHRNTKMAGEGCGCDTCAILEVCSVFKVER